MKQIEKDKLCYWCLGCCKQECDNYMPVMRCNNFVPDRENWREELYKEMKNK